MGEPEKDLRLIVCDQVAFRATPGGGIIIDLRTGASFEVNRMGAEIWTMLANGTDRGAIAETLGGKYEVATQTVRADVEAICSQLLAAGLIVQKV